MCIDISYIAPVTGSSAAAICGLAVAAVAARKKKKKGE
jgi:hypothetical protein